VFNTLAEYISSVTGFTNLCFGATWQTHVVLFCEPQLLWWNVLEGYHWSGKKELLYVKDILLCRQINIWSLRFWWILILWFSGIFRIFYLHLEAASCSKMLVTIYQYTCHYIQEGCELKLIFFFVDLCLTFMFSSVNTTVITHVLI
jgi:hypothetical protein